jgi:hypothetical protein
MRLRRLGRQFLDLEFTPTRDARVRVIERPGLSLDDAGRRELVETLRGVVSRSLPAESLDYGVLTGSKERLDNAVITVIYDRADGRAVAFNALAFMSIDLRGQRVDVLHLGLIVVDPSFRAQGLSWVLYGLTTILIFTRKRLKPLWVSNVTQVPAIVGKFCESFNNAYPAPHSRRSFEHLVIAREIMRRHRQVFGVGAEAGFDEVRFVITDAYTGGSDNLKKRFEDAQPHREETYNDMCRRELDYRRGDDFLQIGVFDLAAARKYLLRSVPSDSLPAVFYHLVFALLGVLVMPVLAWFSVSEPMGELRPWKK